MGEPWFRGLKGAVQQACVHRSGPWDAVLFYVARWCQKESRAPEPDLGAWTEQELCEIATRIARNLAEDGEVVERLANRDGDAEAWTELTHVLRSSARRRVGPSGDEHAEEARQKIAVILLTGTPPSRAVEELHKGPNGSRNEYVFQSPFWYWARRIVINLVVDDARRRARAEHREDRARRRSEPPFDLARLAEARDALPALIDEIRELPPKQRAVMVATMCRSGLDNIVHEHLHRLAPDLFPEDQLGRLTSDDDIAEHLGATTRQVGGNRWAARKKLVAQDVRWDLLLDVLMPHASTRARGD